MKAVDGKSAIDDVTINRLAGTRRAFAEERDSLPTNFPRSQRHPPARCATGGRPAGPALPRFPRNGPRLAASTGGARAYRLPHGGAGSAWLRAQRLPAGSRAVHHVRFARRFDRISRRTGRTRCPGDRQRFGRHACLAGSLASTGSLSRGRGIGRAADGPCADGAEPNVSAHRSDMVLYPLFRRTRPGRERVGTGHRLTLRKIYSSASGAIGAHGADTPSPFDLLPRSSGLLDSLRDPPVLPAWLPPSDLEAFVQSYRASGFRGGWNDYRNRDRNWARQAGFDGLTVRLPALFLIGERDTGLAIPGMQDVIDAMSRLAAMPRASRFRTAGHWFREETPELNEALLTFLSELSVLSAKVFAAAGDERIRRAACRKLPDPWRRPATRPCGGADCLASRHALPRFPTMPKPQPKRS